MPEATCWACADSRMYSLTAGGPSPRSWCEQGLRPLQAVREDLPPASLWASGSPWLAAVQLWSSHGLLPARGLGPDFPFYKDTSPTGLGPDPIQDDLILADYISKEPVSK